MIRAAQLLVGVALLAEPCAPALAQENLSLFGYGGQACDDWRRPENFANGELKSWMLAYADHIAHDDSYRVAPGGLDPSRIVAWVDAYCAEHPLTGLKAAGIMMFNDFAAAP